MALQSSGPISINDIRRELGTANSSLRALSQQAGKGTPDAMSEFYGYSNVTVYAQLLGYDTSNMDRACLNAFNSPGRYTTNDADFGSSTVLWRNLQGTVLATAGWYSSQESVVRYWNGSTFTTTRFCRI